MEKDIESHKQILKSTGIVGGAQLFSIIIGIVRTKVIALLLGPAGVGVLGILQSITDLVRNATGFGINLSGVRDIAEAASTEDQSVISKTIIIIRRWAFGTGLLGMVITIVLCVPLSNYSFGNNRYALSIAIISVTLFITSISSSQIALLQGLRMIGQMAKATILGAFLSTIITLPLYWWLGIQGIVPGMIFSALIALFVSWILIRKIKIVKPILSFKETLKGGWSMARLGFFMVISGFITTATMYLVKAFIVNKTSIDEVGYFQSAWMISNVYIGIILNAMLADFFPRLSAINKDNKASNILINEQLEMALLIGTPMIISLIACAGLVLQVLYSSKFAIATPLLHWQLAGSFFVIILWPLGVMFLAKNKGVFSIIINSVWSVTYFLFIYFGWNYVGFNILGIAYFIAAIFQLISIYFGAKYIGHFSFSNVNIRYIVLFGIATILTLINVLCVENYLQYVFSSILMLIVFLYSYSQLKKIIDFKKIFLSRILKR